VRFAKYHALGNDYLVVAANELPSHLTPAQIRRICDRNRGVGADGVLTQEPDPATHHVRIFNPDGSEAEKSGNGLRIFARFLWDRGAVNEAPFAIDVLAGRVVCQVRNGGNPICVSGPRREVLDEPLEIDGNHLKISAATIGNPHCVVPRTRVSREEAKTLGPIIERHSLFPNRTNVQFMQVEDSSNLRLEIWERGVGYTLASGSSSCAAAAVAHRLCLCGREITVTMPGGSLSIQLSESFDVRMTGPVTPVAEIDLLAEALEGAV